MKELLLIAFFAICACSTVSAQPGTTILYEDNFGPLTFTWLGVINGKNAYVNTELGGQFLIQWAGTEWVILEPGVPSPIFSSSLNTATNPPSTAITTWDDDADDGTQLVSLTGSGTTNSVLPVEFSSLTAVRIKAGSQVSWTTSSEDNNSGFVVERRTDGEQNFQELDFIPGYGTTLEEQHYEYIDDSPAAGMNYYRLKQLDFDGQFAYSTIVTVVADERKFNTIDIYPNPTNQGFTTANIVSAEGGAQSIIVTNVAGQVVLRQRTELTEGLNTVRISTGNLSRGTYLLQVGESGEFTQRRLIIY